MTEEIPERPKENFKKMCLNFKKFHPNFNKFKKRSLILTLSKHSLLSSVVRDTSRRGLCLYQHLREHILSDEKGYNMSCSPTGSFRLSSLPSEVLALILSSDASFLVLNLWKCGDTTLNYRLAEGGCVEVDLNCTRSEKSFWPSSLLAKLKKLRILRIRRRLMISPESFCETVDLFSLPSTLLELTLDFEGATNGFLKNFSKGALCSINPPISNSSGDSSTPTGPKNMAEAFPLLKKLVVGRNWKDKMAPSSSPSFALEDLSTLPKALEFLSLDVNGSSWTTLGDVLPHSLTVLRIGNLEAKNIENWPPALTEVRGCSLNTMKMSQDELIPIFQRLPRGLKSLGSVLVSIAHDPHLLLPLLPRSIDSLALVGKRPIENLPLWVSSLNTHFGGRNLTKLAIFPSLTLLPSMIPLLPRTVTYIEASIDWMSDAEKLDQSIAMQAIGTSNFDYRLREWVRDRILSQNRLDFYSQQTFERLRDQDWQWPPNMKALLVRNNWSVVGELPPSLPSTLTTLSLGYTFGDAIRTVMCEEDDEKSYFAEEERSGLQNLSLGAKNVFERKFPLEQLFNADRCPDLRHLELRSFLNRANVAMVIPLPSNNVEETVAFSNNTLKALRAEAITVRGSVLERFSSLASLSLLPTTVAGITHLPDSLTNLYIANARSNPLELLPDKIELQKNFFQILPRGLQCLIAHASCTAHFSVIEYLPTSLHRLQLSISKPEEAEQDEVYRVLRLFYPQNPKIGRYLMSILGLHINIPKTH